jgi:hypothetical protein
MRCVLETVFYYKHDLQNVELTSAGKNNKQPISIEQLADTALCSSLSVDQAGISAISSGYAQ